MSNTKRANGLKAAWSGLLVTGLLLVATFLGGARPTPAAAAAWAPGTVRPQMCIDGNSSTHAGSPTICSGFIACCK